MSLRQMIDAAEAQREKKPGLSCTQGREQQEGAGAARKGPSDGTDSCHSALRSAHCPDNAPAL